MISTQWSMVCYISIIFLSSGLTRVIAFETLFPQTNIRIRGAFGSRDRIFKNDVSN